MRRYLELRLHGTAYCRRRADAAGAGVGPVRCACRHPLHTDHFHYFGCRDLVASFKYTPVVLSDVVLAERTTVLFFFSISFLDDQRQSCRNKHFFSGTDGGGAAGPLGGAGGGGARRDAVGPRPVRRRRRLAGGAGRRVRRRQGRRGPARPARRPARRRTRYVADCLTRELVETENTRNALGQVGCGGPSRRCS